ncbi:pyruvate, phosphate dikinase [Salimicrobium jeotgali]|uniref:Pyruvate, phosphate dikinase n=1 Tax=Salimicrobium jeotgali TaxID=1230341 RepID=K2FKQ1_9BACI|nr:pyruvate, phosphate dikinase [Salimicrobium jeotgali]AKG04910.1 pyruvate, phosphate dikinase [Salimicrobium jeotgali]EKE31581.1 pyruvate phosphate dikinase [Salimicrobium jeotgali]MBM7696402.1 pyruvate,orthophosphate dikinase [Salimicrobium jeotgali]
MEQKFVFMFDHEKAVGKKMLGGKGANLAEMTRLGLPVPYGFTVTTEACNAYYEAGEQLSEAATLQIKRSMEKLEKRTGKSLGDTNNPLLVSVRSGAVHSMPGMMDTVLNLGMNDETVKAIADLTHNPRFAYDSYRRFIQMFGDVVLGLDNSLYENHLENYRMSSGYTSDVQMTAEDWKEIIEAYKKITREAAGRTFPQDPYEQLFLSIRAVFDSWNNKRAVLYRRLHNIPGHLGTAVNVQSMVFGNMGNDSGTGVAFTRNPSTGESDLYGEYLINAQGEDVVAGIRTPQPINELKREMPDLYGELVKMCNLLEKHYKNMQDIEFTIENGALFFLQTRNGKRTAQSAVRIAVDMVNEGIVSEEEALLLVDPDQLSQLLHEHIDPEHTSQKLVTGLPASPGAATGEVVFDADKAELLSNEGRNVILVRPETTPEDIHGIVAAKATVTSRGGMTSHAAVVARGMGKACICGCGSINIDLETGRFTVAETIVEEGDVITVDGASGDIYLGEIATIEPEMSAVFRKLLGWADNTSTLGVRTNADTPEDVRKAVELGAEGVGLCRTEHMFMDPERLPAVQRMILAENKEERTKALEKLLPMQQQDFERIFETLRGRPITIRLLDPPLHEFLPNVEELLVDITRLELTDPESAELERKQKLLRSVRLLEESNPMLGLRGCRLGMVHPEIYEMQITALFQAMTGVLSKGIDVNPEIMIPLVSHVAELRETSGLVHKVAKEIGGRNGISLNYLTGTMIETPRAALTADEIASEADFFSFGTNDLTQTTFGFSRDDAEGKFLQYYIENGTLPDNPFMKLDQEGVGKLVESGVTLGKQTNPQLKTGICGEHGGDKDAIRFCFDKGLDYVSCSPFRVPAARLAAAQSALGSRQERKSVLQPG